MALTASLAPQTAPTAEADRDALFEALYQAELAWVYRTLRRLGARDGDLEDLAHDVFVAAYRALERFDRRRPARPWLFGIAFRVVSDYRSRARFAREQASPEIEAHASQNVSPESALADAEARALLLRALETLPLEQRAVFIAAELDETPMAELSEHLEVPLNTLYSRLRLARTRLAAALTAYMHDGGRR
jgi:RNA polymerase sigma-70 factor (ECF subfamily)